MNGEIISLETAQKLHIINQVIKDNKKLNNSSEMYETLYKIEYKRRKELEEELKQEKIYHNKYTRLCNRIKELKGKKKDDKKTINIWLYMQLCYHILKFKGGGK